MEQVTMVSVLCTAYNHGNYIRDALEGFVAQKTSFPFEVIVHDDASTDNTAEIIREFEEKYAGLIKPIYQKENQWHKQDGTIGRLFQEKARGKYIAICEGDDFWIDPNKLQKQVELLEKNPQVDICATGSVRIHAETKKKIGEHCPAKTARLFSMEEVLMGGGGFVATNTLVYRSTLLHNQPRFKRNLDYDYSLQMMGAMSGGLLYLPDITGSYRVFAKDSWTSRMQKDKERYIEFQQRVINMLKEFDEDTAYCYHETVEMAQNRELYLIQACHEDYKAMMENPYYKYQGFKHRIRPFLRRYLGIKI